MKIAHLSDLHFCMKYFEEVTCCLDYAIKEIIKQECDVIVISGDSTEARLDLNSPATAALLQRVKRLADHAPVYMLQGTLTHEPPGTLEAFKTIGGTHPTYIADKINQVALVDGKWIESENWAFSEIPNGARVLFSALPSINKGAVAAAVGAENTSKEIGEQVAALLKSWSVNNNAARAQGIPAVVISHGTVAESISEHGVPMVGMDNEYTTGVLFAAEASAVMMGHIHKQQTWEREGRYIAYAGSIGRLHFGEVGNKGFLVWNVQANNVSLDFHSTPARKLKDIDFGESPPDMDSLERDAKNAEGQHVRIRYSIDEEHRHSVNKEAIKALFDKAEQVKIEARILPVQRTRAAGMNLANSVPEKLERWGEVTQTDTLALKERLELLQHTEPKKIVAQLLSETEEEKANDPIETYA